MGSQRTSFAKLQRDRAKKAKAAAKRETRLERVNPEEVDPLETAPDDGTSELSAPELLALIEQIHHQYEAKQISQDDFEERKADLLARLPID
jgi:hypothetical protein